jgi:hypothetical protein
MISPDYNLKTCDQIPPSLMVADAHLRSAIIENFHLAYLR